MQSEFASQSLVLGEEHSLMSIVKFKRLKFRSSQYRDSLELLDKARRKQTWPKKSNEIKRKDQYKMNLISWNNLFKKE